jgi:hypothetical protein
VTYSIVARDPETGLLAVAVQTAMFAAGRACRGPAPGWAQWLPSHGGGSLRSAQNPGPAPAPHCNSGQPHCLSSLAADQREVRTGPAKVIR